MTAPPPPDVSDWVPRTDAATRLSTVFRTRCRAIEEQLLLRARQEKSLNIDNFDSGPGIEDMFREELGRLLPSRYAVRCGVINDRTGATGGDYDIVVFNEDWFPSIKAPATGRSRRAHFPIEGVYAVGEVKQTLSLRTLDDAMKKLVIAHRLHRPPVYGSRLSENRTQDEYRHSISNPLFSFVVAGQLAPDLSMDDVVWRFSQTNQMLRRLEMVHVVGVLEQGLVRWVRMGSNGAQPALFLGEDLHLDLHPALESGDAPNSTMYSLARALMDHLFHCILAPEGVATSYGEPGQVKFALSEDLAHSAYSRPTPSSDLQEWSPVASGLIDEELGAHVEPSEG
ncbi:DUF6602 domain-containing protein [Plesiocystis pacifica]|uniref:DUF6602 domain-containing protein n=1 Tax=Plesiocystis pacifica TaxID=191768 RepID=UPI0012F709C5|nr:DUF6602 domain-containing protein [Plesiocystis pacifica]